jgi:hypothetical protein
MNAAHLYEHLLKVVDAVSAADMVAHKFPEWSPPRQHEVKPHAPIFRQDELAPRKAYDTLVWRTNYGGPRTAQEYPRAKAALAHREEMLARAVNRDPCFKCGVRADIGCKHQ